MAKPLKFRHPTPLSSTTNLGSFAYLILHTGSNTLPTTSKVSKHTETPLHVRGQAEHPSSKERC
jgi:hypothetical protein